MNQDQATTPSTRKICAKCGTVARPGQRFCVTCGSSLTGSSGPREVHALNPHESAWGQGEAVQAATLAAALERRRSDRRAVQTVREIRASLGVALIQANRVQEACEAFEKALGEDGDVPSESDLQLALGEAAVTQPGGRALKAFLAASLTRPELLDVVLPKSFSLMSEEAALAQARWIREEWLPRMQSAARNGTDRARAFLIAGALNLVLGDPAAALDAFGHARTADSEVAAETSPLLGRVSVSPRLAATEAERLVALARVEQALGNNDRALDSINRALETVGSSAPGYPDAPMLRLKGELLEGAGKAQDAAASFFDAGRRFLWRNDANEAIASLRHAHSLDPALVGVYWSLADSLLLASYRGDADAKDFLAQARQVWEAGYARQVPTEFERWTYATRALIAEREIQLDPKRSRSAGLWQAVSFVERALVFDPDDTYRLANLSNLHRQLLNYAVALESARLAYESNAKNSQALEALVVVLTNLGHFDEAEKYLAELRDVRPDDWGVFVKSRLQTYSNHPKDALQSIEGALQNDSKNPTYLTTKSLILRRLGETHKSREIAEALLSTLVESNPDHRLYLGSSALECGDIDRAQKYFELEADLNPDQSQAASARRFIALCLLARGRADEARALFRKNLPVPFPNEDALLLTLDLEDVERGMSGWADPRQAQSVIAEFKALVRNVPRSPAAASAREEIEKWLTGTVSLPESDSTWIVIGATAGLARIAMAESRFDEAARLYQRILHRAVEFREAKLGLYKAIRKLQELGDDLLKKGSADAVVHYREALAGAGMLSKSAAPSTKDAQPASPSDEDVAALTGDLEAGLAFACFKREDDAGTLEKCRASIDRYTAAGEEEAAARLGATFARLTGNVRDHWGLDDWIATKGPELAPARLAMARYLDRLYQLPDGATIPAPAVTPIVTEIATGLVPTGDDKDWPLFKKYIPEMRDRLKKEMGVRVPGIRVRSNENFGEGGFSVELDEVPMLNSHVGESRDPLEFVINTVESVLRKNLTVFLGLQEVSELVDAWNKDDRELVREGVGSRDLRELRFILRELLRERVPIADWKSIFQALKTTSAGDIDGSVRAARLSLKRMLPGNLPDHTRVALPESIEKALVPWLARYRERTFLAIPPEETQEVLSEIRSLINDQLRTPTLVTTRGDLRPSLRRLVEVEFPDVMTLSSEELLEERPAP